MRQRIDIAPRTVTEKVTNFWKDAWEEKSEKWAREMPEKFITGAGHKDGRKVKEEKVEVAKEGEK